MRQPFSVYNWFRQPIRVARGFFWFIGFCLLLLPALEKCGAQQGPPPAMTRFLTETNVRYDPALPWFSEYKQPAIYKEWWKDIAECEGFDALPDSVTSKIQFFQINAPSFMYDDSPDVVLAVSFMADNQIYVASPFIWQRGIIRHEMLHAILWYYGIRLGGFHPVELFEACGLHRGGYQ